MSLNLDIGYAAHQGLRSAMEDFAGVMRPGAGDFDKGTLVAIADGVSAGGLGAMASRTSVLSLLSDYFATPPTWEVTVALDRVISAHNTWLTDQNRRCAPASAMSTLSALVLRGHGYTLAHIGDTRVTLVREGALTELTQEHRLDHQDLRSGLTRALGLDDALRMDYQQGDLQSGDCFVLTTDGIHGVTTPRRWQQVLLELVTRHGSAHEQGLAQRVADDLLAWAQSAGSRDNMTAVVIRVLGLDAALFDDAARRALALPVPARLSAGSTIDGLTVLDEVHSNEVHRVYRVRDPQSGKLFALKALNPSRASDPEERAMMAHEAWLGARLMERGAKGLVAIDEQRPREFFYTLSDWVDGDVLAHQLERGRRYSVAEFVAAAKPLVEAVAIMHRSGVIHRDIKPHNILQGADGTWRLLDLGVALSGREPETVKALRAGTPSYINPEQWGNDPELARATPGSDLYALGVTFYEWLTGRLPYGTLEPYQLAPYRRDPVAPSRIRPDLPIWLDALVLKSMARDPKQRFETAEEMLLALERAAARPVGLPTAAPLLMRDPSTRWKLALMVSVAFNLALVFWLLFLPK